MIDRRIVLTGLGGMAVSAPLLMGAALGPSSSPIVSGFEKSEDIFRAVDAGTPTVLRVGGGEIDVVFAEPPTPSDRTRILAWIRKSAVAVSTYWGRFPVPKVKLLVVRDDSDKVGHGTTFGFHGSVIRIFVGRSVTDDAFNRDWVMVHEMTHLALPQLPRRNLWLQEGNAVYLEPVARAQAGQLEPAMVWRWTLEDMVKGEPGPDDQGLDHTATWGRTYWGGAMFYLVADVAIFTRTQGRRSLRDAMRAVNRASGGNTAVWVADQIMDVGDQATGVEVLQPMYAEWKDTPMRVDLDALFERLGVAEVAGEVMFDNSAPLAAFTRALTRRSAEPLA
jgi:hypothetical protein